MFLCSFFCISYFNKIGITHFLFFGIIWIIFIATITKSFQLITQVRLNRYADFYNSKFNFINTMSLPKSYRQLRVSFINYSIIWQPWYLTYHYYIVWLLKLKPFTYPWLKLNFIYIWHKFYMHFYINLILSWELLYFSDIMDNHNRIT